MDNLIDMSMEDYCLYLKSLSPAEYFSVFLFFEQAVADTNNYVDALVNVQHHTDEEKVDFFEKYLGAHCILTKIGERRSIAKFMQSESYKN